MSSDPDEIGFGMYDNYGEASDRIKESVQRKSSKKNLNLPNPLAKKVELSPLTRNVLEEEDVEVEVKEE